MNKRISILGSTGSIGTQTLEVCRKLSLPVTALSAYNSIGLLEEQIREFKPALAVVYDEEKAKELKIKIADTDTKVLSGMEGLYEICHDDADLLVNSVVGMVGLAPTLEAIKAKKDIAFANKETLVAGGELVMNAVKENGVTLYPVDSEHSAIFQCLQGMHDKTELKSILLTASGGPFFGKSKEALATVTLAQALKHPNWSMGAKITVDSATMMNKGLELIEAVWLFDVTPEQIQILVHRESIVHSAVEFSDNAVIAQLGVPDMRVPIQYALTYPARIPSPVKRLSLSELGTLHFCLPDEETFRCLPLCRKAIARGGLAPCIANGANEMANALFREGKIGFLQIADLVEGALENVPSQQIYTRQDVFDADKAARDYVLAQQR